MDDRSFPGIPPYASRLIRYKARQLSRQPGFRLDERCDLEHDLLTDLIDRLPKFDSATTGICTTKGRQKNEKRVMASRTSLMVRFWRAAVMPPMIRRRPWGSSGLRTARGSVTRASTQSTAT